MGGNVQVFYIYSNKVWLDLLEGRGCSEVPLGSNMEVR